MAGCCGGVFLDFSGFVFSGFVFATGGGDWNAGEDCAGGTGLAEGAVTGADEGETLSVVAVGAGAGLATSAGCAGGAAC